ncbi:MAG: hypothetical protein IJ212_04700 [Bacteroidaceae bacterium]|nr:hypothetical protein [Bacteroidaceae bacterium]
MELNINVIKTGLNTLLSWIDSGNFFKKPMKVLYMITGYLSFLLPIALLVAFFNFKDIIEDFTSIKSLVDDGWPAFLYMIFIILFFIILFLLSYINFLFWKNRSEKLESLVKTGDQIVVIPVWADYVQSTGEVWGIFWGIVPSITAILALVFYILSGAIFEDNFLLNLLVSVIGCALFILFWVICGFIIILMSHFIGESMRLKAQMANDIRDIGDIARAATFENIDTVAPDVKEEKDSTEQPAQA